MNNFNLMPQVAQPVNRITTGQLPSELAELSEEALSVSGGSSTGTDVPVLPSLGSCFTVCCGGACYCQLCSYDGDDGE